MLYQASLLLAIVSNSILVFLLLHRRDRANSIISFIIFLLLINFWAIPYFFINALHLDGLAYEMLSRLASFGYIFIPAAFFVFSISFMMQYQWMMKKFLFWILLLLPPFIFLFISWSTNLISVHDYHAKQIYEWGYAAPGGALLPVFIIWFDSVMLHAVIIMVQTYRLTTNKTRKRQIMFIILAILIPLIIATINDGILPMLNIMVFPLAVPLASIMAIIIVFTMYRFGLFEVTQFSIFSSIEQGIITMDNRGKVIQMNAFAENFLGVRTNAAENNKVDEVIHFVNKNGKTFRIQRKLFSLIFKHARKVKDSSYLLVDKHQRKMPVSITIAPVMSGKTVIGATLTFRDITKERLRDQYKDDFISLVSHELKTPLTSIKAYNQLMLKMLREGNTSKSERIMLRIDDELTKLTRLITDFIDFSRIESRRMKLEKELMAINEVVRETVNNVKVAFPSRTIIVRGKVNTMIWGDKDRISQVLTNLLSNAIRYSPTEKKIIVSLQEKSRNVILAVRDYGIGISPEYQKKIFERFYQLSEMSTAGGLGLGLYISAEIVRQHNGKIWVSSKKGRGSIFYVILPKS